MTAHGPNAEPDGEVPAVHGPVSDTPQGERVAAFLDIGTNSVRLLLVHFMANGTHSVISQQKEIVRLGEDEFIDGFLRPEAMRRATLVMRKFREMAEAYHADEIVAIATSATREARNRDDFLRMLRQEAGIEVRTISGREEARLIYLGVSSGMDLGDDTALFIDIGGGSTELVIGDQSTHHFLDSLKLGAIRLTSLFFMPNEDAPVRDDRYLLIQRYVRNSAVRTLQQMEGRSYDRVIGSSGTIQNLVEMAVRERGEGPNDSMSLGELRALRQRLCQLDLAARRNVSGINASRADLIIAGAAILETLMEDLGLETIVASDRGLREGLIVDDKARRHPDALEGASIRDRSVLQLGRRCRFDEAHGRHVARLAQQIFDDAVELGLHRLGAPARELLGHAAMLHDIGTFLSYDNHQLHSYYLIHNADLLGFDQTEAATVAAVARFHRKGFPRKKHREYRILDKGARKLVRPLAVFLRLAEALDRSHAGLVERAGLRRLDGERILLELHSQEDCQLELWGAQGHRGAFERAFKQRLELERVIAPATANAPLEHETRA